MDELANAKESVEAQRAKRRPRKPRLCRMTQSVVHVRLDGSDSHMVLFTWAGRSDSKKFWSAAYQILAMMKRNHYDMRGTTNVHIAVRNIGDSQDTGKYFEGQLKDSIFWLAAELANISMASRIVVGIGRSKEDAARGIEVKNAGTTVVTDEMKSLLDSVFNDSPSTEDPSPAQANGVAQRLEGDDWVEPTQ